MNSTERLKAAQAKLQEQGYVDLKFFFKLDLVSNAKSDVEDGLASLVNKFTNGEYKPSTFSDRHLVIEPKCS